MSALRVVSWNVLADAYVKAEYFPFTDPKLLDPDWRSVARLERLASEPADVLCLQEVEPPFFEDAARRLSGFRGRFLQKTGRPDGCAIFVRRAEGAAPVWREIVYRDGTGHGALAVVTQGIGVVTTHLKWQPPAVPTEERLSVAELTELCEAFVVPNETWIVCGDLNAESPSTTLDVAFARGLVDAFASSPNAYTANANGRAKRIDYFLHTADLRATTLGMPAIDAKTPLPSESQPSDHLAIRAMFESR